MPLRTIALAAMTSGMSMCATTPPEPPPPPPEAEYQTGPDGLPIRHAPTEAVEADPLPAAASRGEAEGA